MCIIRVACHYDSRCGRRYHPFWLCRLELLALFELHCQTLCGASGRDRIRYLYETLRDRLVHPAHDDPDAVEQVGSACVRSLTRMILLLDLPGKDARLTKAHVEYLFRTMQLCTCPEKRRISGTAVECLQLLEDSFPTLLYKQAASLLKFAMTGTGSSVAGIKSNVTVLAATVLGNACSLYLNQQDRTRSVGGQKIDDEAKEMGLSEKGQADDCRSASSSNLFMEEEDITGVRSHGGGDGESMLCNGDRVTDRILRAAADALNSVSYSSADETHEVRQVQIQMNEATNNKAYQDSRAGENQTGAESAISVDHRAGGANSGSLPEQERKGREAVRGSYIDEMDLDSPSGILSADINMSAICSTESSRRSMLSSVVAADTLSKSSRNSSKNRASTSLISTFGSKSRDSELQRDSCLTTPRSVSELRRVPLLESIDSDDDEFISFRFFVPHHVQHGDITTEAPELIMDAAATEALEKAAIYFFGILRRINADKVSLLGDKLVSMLKTIEIYSAGAIWHAFERSIAMGNSVLLRVLLDIFDAVPWLSEMHAADLLQKILRQANDQSFSPEYRTTCLNWALRQHAMQRHAGTELVLADAWTQLIPAREDPMHIAASKIKILAACMESGIGDEETICRGSLGYFLTSRHTSGSMKKKKMIGAADIQRKTFIGTTDPRRHHSGDGKSMSAMQCDRLSLQMFTYSVRQLHAALPESGPAAARGLASLVWATLHAIVIQPSLVPAIDDFLNSCAPESAVVEAICAALDTMFGAVEGSFEVLQDQPEDAFYDGSNQKNISYRVKSAILSRASSLSGLMRGFSFSLPSFSKRSSESPRGATGRLASARGEMRMSKTSSLSRTISGGGDRRSVSNSDLDLDVPVRSNQKTSSGPSQDVGEYDPKLAAFDNVSVGRSNKIPTTAQPDAVGELRAAIAATFAEDDDWQLPCAGSRSHGGVYAIPSAFQRRSCDLSASSLGGSSLKDDFDAFTPRARTASQALDGGDDPFSATQKLLRSDLDVSVVPRDISNLASAMSWLTASSTWNEPAAVLLRRDLMRYRCLLQRAMRFQGISPLGSLRTLANYAWQYKTYHPLHALDSSQTAGAILALCQTAALCHLPRRTEEPWTTIQESVSEAILVVVDAMEDAGFPAGERKPGCRLLASLLQDTDAWLPSSQAETLTKLLGNYIDAAIDG